MRELVVHTGEIGIKILEWIVDLGRSGVDGRFFVWPSASPSNERAYLPSDILPPLQPYALSLYITAAVDS